MRCLCSLPRRAVPVQPTAPCGACDKIVIEISARCRVGTIEYIPSHVCRLKHLRRNLHMDVHKMLRLLQMCTWMFTRRYSCHKICGSRFEKGCAGQPASKSAPRLTACNPASAFGLSQKSSSGCQSKAVHTTTLLQKTESKPHAQSS